MLRIQHKAGYSPPLVLCSELHGAIVKFNCCCGEVNLLFTSISL